MALSLDEALGMSLVDWADESIHVDIDTRQVMIPESQQVFGVESDEDVEVKHIVIDGRYNDGTDLSTFTFRVNYQNANGDKGTYLATELKVNDDSIEFDWVIGRQVVVYKGTIAFIVCAYTIDSSSVIQNEWNSTLGKGTVLEGLEVSEFDFGDDIVRQLASILSDVNAAQASAKASADEAYKSKTEVVALGKEQQAAIEKKGKDTLATIPDDYTQISNDVSQLKEDTAKLRDGKISKFYASSQGNINLPDSDDGRIMDLMLYGKSSQQQYRGKNLWSIGDIEINTNSYVAIDIPKGTYTFSRDGSTARLSLRLYWGDTDTESILVQCETSKTVSFTVENNVKKLNWNVENYVSPITKIQIEKGSTATAYEPYVGGIPSPNPEYPQEIKAVVNPSIKVCGKNLVQKIVYGYINSSNTVQIDNASVSAIAYVIKGKEYTISCPIIMDRFKVGIIDASAVDSPNGVSCKVIIDNQGSTTVKKFRSTFTGYTFIYINSTKNESIANKLQVECGSTATDYEPYTESTATLPYTLNAIPVTSGGNVTIDGQQYIADYVDVERGKLVTLIQAYKPTTCTEKDSSTNELFQFGKGMYEYSRFGLCNMLPITDGAESAVKMPAAFYFTGDYNLWCKIPQLTADSTVDDATAWAKQYKPVFYGVLATLTETDLTADEIAAFKALVSYYPVTNVSTTSDQLDGYTVFNYPISLANGWNYVKQQLGDTRDYLYGIDLMTAEAYVNSEYAAALAEIEV